MLIALLCTKMIYLAGCYTVASKVVVPFAVGVVEGIKDGVKELKNEKTKSSSENKEES